MRKMNYNVPIDINQMIFEFSALSFFQWASFMLTNNTANCETYKIQFENHFEIEITFKQLRCQ